MAGKADKKEVERLESLSMDRRKLVGQAIIDGILSPRHAALIDLMADPDYNQGQGNYTQKGGDHKQGGGDYNQSPAMLERFEPVINEIRTGSVIRE